MQHAGDRGIHVCFFTWNVFTWRAEGKHGITNDLGNETTKKYFRASVREMVKTYPLLAGLGITLENLAPGRKTWLTVRNDDIFTFRFGDPAYASECILKMPQADKLAGFYTRPDGYVWGRDFLERHPAPGPRPLVIE